MNEEADDKKRGSNSNIPFRSPLQSLLTENSTELEDGESQNWSKYEMFCYMISYTVMFLSRLGKDLFRSSLDWLGSKQSTPDHIEDLLKTSKRLHLENNTRALVRFYNNNQEKYSSIYLSESSLEVHIPSYPGSPRSLNIGSGHSYEYHDNPYFAEAVEFLHRDKDFLIAAETGDHKLLEILLRKRTDVEQQRDHLGRNALHLAVCSDSEAAVILLLKTAIKTNVKDNLGMTPLSLCLMRRPSYKIANLLFNHGAVIAPRSNPVDTGLFLQFVMMCTPTKEDADILELLVNKGAIVNDPESPGGRQALHFAAMSNNCQLIRILVNLGGDLTLTNHRKETPKDVAKIFKCKEAYELLSDLEDEMD